MLSDDCEKWSVGEGCQVRHVSTIRLLNIVAEYSGELATLEVSSAGAPTEGANAPLNGRDEITHPEAPPHDEIAAHGELADIF